MGKLGFLGWIAFALVLIGGIDAGLFGIFQFHILTAILGLKFVGRVFYILIGLGAAYLIYHMAHNKKF